MRGALVQRILAFLGTVLSFTLLASSLQAAEVKIFRGDKREATLAGTLDALAVDALGALTLARRVKRRAEMEEPFVFTAAGHPDGWVVGTGSSGKVLLVDPSGRVNELFTTAEGEVFAVECDEKGTVYAGGSPYGSVYSFADGESKPIFDPAAAYVWDLAIDAKGRLLVATGFPGRLHRIDRGVAEVLYESSDSHVRAVEPLADGSVLVGTAGQGLILHVAADATVRTLHDSVAPEVLAFASDGATFAYAAVLASEASLVDLSASLAPVKNGAEDGKGEVSVVAQTTETTGSRSSGATGPRSQLLRIELASGRVEELQSFDEETVHSLLYHQGELWIGTGQEGRLYRLDGKELVLERDLEERQVTAIAAGGQGAAALTNNGAALYAILEGIVDEGTYTSTVLDAGQVARFGSFVWRGEQPAGSRVTVAVRSGMAVEPDATWTPWIPARATAVDEGQGAPLGEVPAGRYVQWRSTLAGGARISRTELTYRQENLRPKIKSFEALDPGQILVPASFNPQTQTFEPWSPNREGIFTSLRPEKEKNGEGRLKTLWKRGYRSLKWEASDANEDPLLYSLAFRRNGDDTWLTMVNKLDEPYYSFDATVLPDGVYRFRLRACDDQPGAQQEPLVAEQLSEPVVIDHTPPRLLRARRRDGVLQVELADGLNPLRDVVVSTDAGEWRSVAAEDGLLDGRRETLRVPLEEGTRFLLLRATDAAWNVVTFDLLAEKP